ncbi:MAG: hypothetical protein MUE96_07355 [Bacteroidia bacterium]|jgi:ferritin|nr:hypothetical protein [Bacteroidia bacterium]
MRKIYLSSTEPFGYSRAAGLFTLLFFKQQVHEQLRHMRKIYLSSTEPFGYSRAAGLFRLLFFKQQVHEQLRHMQSFVYEKV